MTGQLGKPHLSSLLTWLALPANVLLLFLLVPRFGFAGAATATAATWAVLFFAFLAFFIAKTGLTHPGDYLVPKPEDFRSFARYFRQFFHRG